MLKALDIWLPGYAQSLARRRERDARPPRGPITFCLAVTDHFEPFWGRAGLDKARERLAAWEKGFPKLRQGLRDWRGKPPAHDFYYPADEYHPEVLDRLAGWREKGWGEVEVHLHHHGETSAQLEDLLLSYLERLETRHGLLRRDPASGRLTYGFIHGNWALDNSRPDGGWCGVNDELSILERTGCFADFTLPSAPDRTQTSTVNSVYYAVDDPERPKSHDRGRPARVGAGPEGDLLLVQGILAPDWGRRKWGLLPRVETSELEGHHPPSPARAAIWTAHAPWVEGAGEVRFIKLHCHGAPGKNHEALLGPAMRNTLEHMLSRYNDGKEYRTLFMTSWEMVQTIHALERGENLPCLD